MSTTTTPESTNLPPWGVRDLFNLGGCSEERAAGVATALREAFARVGLLGVAVPSVVHEAGVRRLVVFVRQADDAPPLDGVAAWTAHRDAERARAAWSADLVACVRHESARADAALTLARAAVEHERDVDALLPALAAPAPTPAPVAPVFNVSLVVPKDGIKIEQPAPVITNVVNVPEQRPVVRDIKVYRDMRDNISAAVSTERPAAEPEPAATGA